MTDVELLRDVLAASGMSEFRFALEVLDVNEHLVERWLSVGTVVVVWAVNWIGDHLLGDVERRARPRLI